MDSLIDYWQCFDSEIIKDFSYPMPLKELQLELF